MLKNLTIKSRLIFVIGFMSFLSIGIGVIGLTSLSSGNDSLKSIYENRLVPMGQLDMVIRLIDKSRMTVAESMNGDPAVVNKAMDQVVQRSNEIKKNIDAFLSAPLTNEEKKLSAKMVDDYRKFLVDGLQPGVDALRNSNVQQAMEIMQGPMAQQYVPLQEGIDALIKLQLDVAKSQFEKRQSIYSTVRNTSIAAIAFGVILAAFIGLWLIRAITAIRDRPDSTEAVTSGIPLLVVAGAEDHLISAEVARELAAASPNGRAEVIEGCGHLPGMERPDEFNRILTTFLDEL
jgi:methyl-accepting chemotaxis protein-1 (serine sensor receptor)